MVHEIKGETTVKPYEKSRLIIQGYKDDGKRTILTQSPTIQRASQRLISKIQRILTAPWKRPSVEEETVDVSALLAQVQSDPRQSQWQKQANPTEAVPFTSRTGPPPALSISAVSTAKWKTLDGKPIPFPTGEDPAHIRLVRETLPERLTHPEGFFSKKSSTHLPSPDSRREVVLELCKPLSKERHFCIDYRWINQVLVSRQVLAPDVNGTIANCRNAKRMTKIDIIHAFNRLLMYAGWRHLTAF